MPMLFKQSPFVRLRYMTHPTLAFLFHLTSCDSPSGEEESGTEQSSISGEDTDNSNISVESSTTGTETTGSASSTQSQETSSGSSSTSSGDSSSDSTESSGSSGSTAENTATSSNDTGTTTVDPTTGEDESATTDTTEDSSTSGSGDDSSGETDESSSGSSTDATTDTTTGVTGTSTTDSETGTDDDSTSEDGEDNESTTTDGEDTGVLIVEIIEPPLDSNGTPLPRPYISDNSERFVISFRASSITEQARLNFATYLYPTGDGFISIDDPDGWPLYLSDGTPNTGRLPIALWDAGIKKHTYPIRTAQSSPTFPEDSKPVIQKNFNDYVEAHCTEPCIKNQNSNFKAELSYSNGTFELRIVSSGRGLYYAAGKSPLGPEVNSSARAFAGVLVVHLPGYTPLFNPGQLLPNNGFEDLLNWPSKPQTIVDFLRP